MKISSRIIVHYGNVLSLPRPLTITLAEIDVRVDRHILDTDGVFVGTEETSVTDRLTDSEKSTILALLNGLLDRVEADP